MKDLDSILDAWSEDCAINKMKLDDTSRETPLLHAKYLRAMTDFKLKLKRAEFKQKTLLKKKWLYYNGKMNQQDIDGASAEWDFAPYDPLDGLKVLKSDMHYYYDSDPDIIKSEEIIQYYKTVIETLKEIVSSINWRHTNIKNMIEWRKFQEGG